MTPLRSPRSGYRSEGYGTKICSRINERAGASACLSRIHTSRCAGSPVILALRPVMAMCSLRPMILEYLSSEAETRIPHAMLAIVARLTWLGRSSSFPLLRSLSYEPDEAAGPLGRDFDPGSGLSSHLGNPDITSADVSSGRSRPSVPMNSQQSDFYS